MKKKIKQNTNTAGVKYCTADGNVLLQSGPPKRFSKSAALLASAAIILSAALFALGLYFLVDKVDHAAAKADEAILQEKSSEATDIDLANALRTSAADRVVADETIPAYSNAQVRSMDVSKPSGVTEAELKLITKGNLKGLESSFVKAEKDYGVNCLFVIAIGFSSKAECINVVSKALAQNYLRPGGSLYCGKTISDVNKRYAASSTWDDKVAARMTSYYGTISKNRNAVLDKLK